MKLVLHIGTEKTGTTSIQDWIYCNRVELSRRGVYLSHVLGVPNNQILAYAFEDRVDPYFLPMGIDTLEAVAAFRRDLMLRFEEEMAQARRDHDVMVVTSEQFQSCLRTRDEVAQLGQWLGSLFARTTIVCYLRHQVEMRRSRYSTLVRMGYTGTLEEFDTRIDEEAEYYNLSGLVKRWSGVFGRENLLLREYRKGGSQEWDVVRDFLANALGDLEPEGFDVGTRGNNAALTDSEIAVYLLINRWFKYCDNSGNLKRGNARVKRLADALLSATRWKRPRTGLPKDDGISREIAERFARSNRVLSDEYFGGKLFADLEF